MSKDKDLIERMNKKMSGVNTCRHSEDDVQDMNKNVLKYCKNERLMNDISEFWEERKKHLSLRKEPLTAQEGAMYSRHMNEDRYVSTDTSDSKDYTATYIYKFPTRYRDEFRLLYAKVNEVRLRMEKVMTSNDDADYAYELKKYNEWLGNIVK